MNRISLHVWFCLNILLLLSKVSPCRSLASASSLCESTDLPCKPENPSACQMKYFRLNSTECRDLTFDGKQTSRSDGDPLGTVELKSFFYNILSYKMTAFNVTFSDIKWKHLKFRFKQIGNDMKNTCREFFVLANATVSDMFYDCIWSNETYEGKPFFFEYEASNELLKIYKKFSFHVPYAKNVDEALTNVKDWETFSYVEAVSFSNGLGPTTFFLNWQPLPQKFSVDSYNVSIMSSDAGTLQVVHSINITCKNITECNYMYSKWYGTVQFGVQPICKDTICSTTTSLVFQVGGERAKPLLIGIICASFCIPVALYVIYMVIKYMAMKEVAVVEKIPKVLVIHSSSVAVHANVVLYLVDYLKNYCYVEPLVDELHIFSSKSRDPFKWCNESFKCADYVMVVASPSSTRKEVPNSVYQRTNVLLLRLLRERLAANHGKTKYFALMLPYSTDRDVPVEAENLRKFHFPRDLNKMLKFIHENRVMPKLFCCQVRDYKLYGKKLSRAIEEAQHYLKSSKAEGGASPHGTDAAEADFQHELLTLKRREPHLLSEVGGRRKESQKTAVTTAESFLDYPGDLESINLLGEGDEEFDGEMTVRRNKLIIDELSL
ncbi:UNVERIFIED_CONTAM: hypothetical protein PYX00_002675 [Menopon gallinae]|uniref:SEFIR domain-containing protein n=1 Tax=Menopon gallinae TaxID=328185 RepID=A0AAW2HXP8_9NEOP